jgi:hypothetical protein
VNQRNRFERHPAPVDLGEDQPELIDVPVHKKLINGMAEQRA